MPLQLVGNKLLMQRTKLVDAGSSCCCCPPLEGLKFLLLSSPYHNCNCARFNLMVNDVLIGLVNFNNFPQGGVVRVEHTITKAQSDQILAEHASAKCCELSVRLECLSYNGDEYGCDNFPFCHQDISYMFVQNAKGELVHEGPVDLPPVTINICHPLNRVFVCDSAQGCVPSASPAPNQTTYATLEECELACFQEYFCSLRWGCQSAGYGTEHVPNFTYYPDLPSCYESCLPRYSCRDNWPISLGGLECIELGYNTTGLTQTECEAICVVVSYGCDAVHGCIECATAACSFTDCSQCVMRYTCDPASGCSETGYSTDINLLTLSQCQTTCTVQSYTCDQTQGCLPRYDNSGELEDCTTCTQRFVCDPISACQYNGWQTTGYTLAECITACTVQSYACDINQGCQPRYDNSGDTANCSNCIERYECHPVNGCSYVGWGLTGLTQAQCQNICTVQSYACEVSGCQPRYDNSGTLADCTTCVERYQCYAAYWNGENYSSCYNVGFGTSGPISQAECCANSPDCAGNPNCGQQFQMQAAPVEIVEPEPQQPQPDTLPLQVPPETSSSSGVTQVGETILVDSFGSDFEREWAKKLGYASVLEVHANKPTGTHLDPKIMNDPTGPGTFLSKTLEKIGIKASPNCSCKARAYKMNEMGVEWCEKNIYTIVGWLREEAAKRKLPFVDLAGKLLVKRAIKLARAAQAQHKPGCSCCAKKSSTSADS